MRRRITKFLVISTLVFILLLMILICWHNVSNSEIAKELIKSLLQVFVVIIFGGLVVRSWEEAKRKENREKETLIKYLTRLDDTYRSVKSSRRKLKSRGLTADHSTPNVISNVQGLCLDEEMQKLNKVQLQLESIIEEMNRLPEFKSAKGLITNLTKMKLYLRELLKEYEKYMPELLADSELEFKKMHRLKAFTTEKDVAESLLNNFWEPFDKVMNALGSKIAK